MPNTVTKIASPSRITSSLKAQFIHTEQNSESEWVSDPVVGLSLIRMSVLRTIS